MTNPDRAEGDDLYISAQEALSSAFDVVVDQIRHNPNPRIAYTEATELSAMLRLFITRAADLRAVMATQIVMQEKLSLTGLAEIVGVSKQRASQLVRTGREVMENEPD